MKIDIKSLDDRQKLELVRVRWASSETLWEKINSVYKANTAVYENQSDWVKDIPEKRRKYTTQSNRIFPNMESVINSLIANPPGLNVLPARDGEEAQDFARKLESFFLKKYTDLNTKEIIRMGLRNLYFGRLVVIKPFWNVSKDDFDYRAIDPRKVRFGKYARKEEDSEFGIEEIPDNLLSVIERFPEKKKELMKKFGISSDADLYVKNPEVKYKESWIQDYVIFTMETTVLDCIKNPYWDWDGILVTEEEKQELDETGENGLETDQRREKMQQIKQEQGMRKQAGEDEGSQYQQYFFNYFDKPRKPYIFATVFNNENSPVGRTDMITLSVQLQRNIDKRKMDIDENCELANGIIKVDSDVMSKADAQRIRFETKGIIWGKGVVNGVQRETGGSLPAMVFQDMQDSRSEIDNIMAASSAFRGEREGQETKAGRLALIQQSYLRLNELVQVVDFLSHEMFSWGMQLAKTRYTEYHYAKWMGKEGARELIEIIQDDFETGSEIKIIAGKTLPVDDEFKFEQAQADVDKGYISPADYLEIAQYDDAKELSKNAVLYQQNPMEAVGIKQQEMPVPHQPGMLTPEQVMASGAPGGMPPTESLPQ